MSVLKERALQFSEHARYALERGHYELALFHVEQYVQLYSKYLLYRRLGDFPKTHYLRDLLDRVVEIYGAVCGLPDFLKKWSANLAVLEYAYISSRYLPYRARREDAEAALRLAEEWSSVALCLENS
ncbi:MAG: HEPN domain-containing protein [Thermoproteus sp.]